MTISIGDTLPEVTLKETNSDGMKEVTTSELFDGKTVVVFAVPGAFTPTCTQNHLPGYLKNFDAIKAKAAIQPDTPRAD